MKRPEQLVQLAMQRTGHAAKTIGPLEIHGHSEMSPCWRPLLRALAKVIPVTWVAGPRHIPAWLGEIGVKIVTSAPTEFATLI